MEHYDYCEQDIIVSEISGAEAQDVHHIIPRSEGGSDDVENLIALTRTEHIKAHSGEYTREQLQEIHKNFEKPLW